MDGVVIAVKIIQTDRPAGHFDYFVLPVRDFLYVGNKMHSHMSPLPSL
jgi:hypothetical protein